jgi:maltooligosyltrehalose synthase
VPRLVCSLLGGENRLPLGAAVWDDTCIDLSLLPSQRAWNDVLTGDSIETAAESGPSLALASILDPLPLALLASRRTDE